MRCYFTVEETILHTVVLVSTFVMPSVCASPPAYQIDGQEADVHTETTGRPNETTSVNSAFFH